MVKVFTENKNGKIEFTKEELEKLLNEVWNDGSSHCPNYPYLVYPYQYPFYQYQTLPYTFTCENSSGEKYTIPASSISLTPAEVTKAK